MCKGVIKASASVVEARVRGWVSLENGRRSKAKASGRSAKPPATHKYNKEGFCRVGAVDPI